MSDSMRKTVRRLTGAVLFAAAVLFGCACHNTTLTGAHYEICGDYAGFAQAHVEKEQPGVQAMFMIGCGGDANPYPRGEVDHVVSEYVPLIQRAVGPGSLWIAAYCNDAFGYLPTKKILQQGGYETRGLIPEAGFFAPEAEDAVVAAVRRLVEAAGRTLPE